VKPRDYFWKASRRTFVTADTHFGDDVALRKFGRPFRSVDECDEALIAAMNARIGRNDVLLHVGDLFGEREWSRGEKLRARRLRDRIRCRRIVLITGNTDPVGERWFDSMIEEAHDILTWRGWPGEERTRVVACHYPVRQWQGWPSGAVHIYGHVHGTLPEVGRSTDVGVDCWKFQPIELSSLLGWLKARPFNCPKEWPRAQAARSAL
jgi:calcineurin-like phosphoesterase family protein